MFHLAQKVYPDLAVIDGFEAMEGDGPAWGRGIWKSSGRTKKWPRSINYENPVPN